MKNKNSTPHETPFVILTDDEPQNQLERAILNAIKALTDVPVQQQANDESVRLAALFALSSVHERILDCKHPGLKDALYWMRNGFDMCAKSIAPQQKP